LTQFRNDLHFQFQSDFGASAYEPFIRPLNELIKEYAQRHHHHRADGDPAPAEDVPESEDETESAV